MKKEDNKEPLILTIYVDEIKENDEQKLFTYQCEYKEPEPFTNQDYAELLNEEQCEHVKTDEGNENTYEIYENGILKNNKIIKMENILNKDNIHCWWCCHQFSSKPLYLPVKYINEQYYVKGYFCSFPCMLTYNKHINDSKINERNSLIYLMKKSMYKTNEKINYALPRSTLKIFGGYLSIEEFRNKSKDNSIKHTIYYPPMIPIIPQIEESKIIHHKKWEHNSTYFMKQASETIKIKRNKPLLNKKFTLDKYMNIKKINV